ncbi:DNA-binding protein [Methylomonas sp. EFPC1]|uniref:DNA-binding protein n=1 Tax=Methylomonas sp. EFPC1 TaxID=2812647 RepID=UPI001967EE86|nr:DNA-binding protein [Methylomonas sp. EFPC1]QSB02007.1 DNA-binding protein [Methylomonas sp. EFPC1]
MTQEQSIDKKVTSVPRKRLRTPKQAKAYLRRNGLTVPRFAQAHGFNQKTVYRVLNGESKALYGDGYQIAVALGMKAPDADVTDLLPGTN